MHKYILKIFNLACIICLFLYFGCDNQAENQQKATVISKKIEAPNKAKEQIKKDSKIEPLISKTKKKDLKSEPIKPKKDPAETVELSDTTDIYTVKGKSDPFASIYRDTSSAFSDQKDRKKEKRIPLTPIEKVDLSQLKLVGIIFSPSGNKALVEEASGKGYIIQKGSYIGINYGSVLKILKDRVIVEEEAEDILGKTTLIKRELKLQKPPGEE